jgi:hypothetical protein
MPKKLALHLVALLLLFILLNATVKWVLIPELTASQTEKQKKYQEDFGTVLLDMPLLGDYIDGLQKVINLNTKTKLDSKSQAYAIEQQFKDQFQYYLQKQILSNSALLVKKDLEPLDKKTTDKASFVSPQNKIPEFPNLETDKSKLQKKDPAPAYFKELSEQLNATQIENILTAFQDHLKKLKPIFSRMEIEILQYEKVIPETIMESENFVTDFHYQLNAKNEIHLAFMNIDSSTSTNMPNLGAIRGIKSFYRADTTLQKANSLLSQVNAPVLDWKTLKTQFPDEKGQRKISSTESTDILQMWRWQQPGTLTTLELYWPTSKNSFSGGVLYDFVLLFFLLLMGVWFYFYHDSHSKEKDDLQFPNEIIKLKKEKKELETLLIDMMETKHKKTLPVNQANEKIEKKSPEKVFEDDSKKSYLIPKEQTYLDSKIDFKKESRDILMEESQTTLLKTLVKKIREEK